MKKRLTLRISLVTLFLLTSATEVLAQSAQKYTPLETIPFLKTDTTNIGGYIEALFDFAIVVAALLVVGRIIIAGVKYMFSEIVTNKEEAKKDIQGALLGLLIILSAVTILNTINPNLTRFNVFENAEQIRPSGQGVAGKASSQLTEQDRSATANNTILFEKTFAVFGTPEHQQFVSDCVKEKGVVVATSVNSKTLQCRSK